MFPSYTPNNSKTDYIHSLTSNETTNVNNNYATTRPKSSDTTYTEHHALF